MQTKLQYKLHTMVIDPASPTREINRKLLLTLHQDGLLDVLAGLIVLTFGLIPVLDESGLNPGVRHVIFLSFYFLQVFVIIWLKGKITLPRTGMVQLSKKTTSRLSLVMLLVNVAVFLLFAGSYLFKISFWEWFGSYQLSIPLGLLFMIIFTVSGALLKAFRFYLYGIVVMISFILSEGLFLKGHVAHHGIPLAGLFSGGVIILSGLIYLLRFLKKYRVD